MGDMIKNMHELIYLNNIRLQSLMALKLYGPDITLTDAINPNIALCNNVTISNYSHLYNISPRLCVCVCVCNILGFSQKCHWRSQWRTWRSQGKDWHSQCMLNKVLPNEVR